MGTPGVGSFGALKAPVPIDAVQMPVAVRALEGSAYTVRTSVRNQGARGSCTGFAFRAALNIIFGGALEVSPGALYHYNKLMSGFDPRGDQGAYMAPSADALVRYGAGSESLHPYDIPNGVEPDAAYQLQALDHRVSRYYRALTVAQVRTALSAGSPVVTSFDVPPGFREVGETGVWNDDGGGALGGHAVCVVGYDDAREGSGALLVQNSWGTTWGTTHPEGDDSEGFFWVPYDVFEGPRFWDGFVVQTWDMEAGG